MKSFLKNYKAIAIGLFITVVLTSILLTSNLILIDNEAIIENVFIFILWWSIISVAIHNIHFFIKNKIVVYKILALLAIIGVTIGIDVYQNTPDNPITIIMVVLFWIVASYLFVPTFFKKYKLPILIIYGAVLAYFLYVRLGYETTNYFKFYKERVTGLFIIPIPVIIALYLFEQWKWLKNLKIKKDKAELALLKSQVNPHFFFNTLNNLYGLTIQKSDQAPEVVLKLSEMMRYTIYQGKKDLVPLNDEIVYLENYIELHKIRFKKNVDIKFNHSIEKEYKIAPLMFIILLENAFKHGVERLTENAYIHINLIAKSDKIIFSIINNFEAKDIEDEKGIGLSNLKERLELIYPNKYELKIEEKDKTYKALLELSIS